MYIKKVLIKKERKRVNRLTIYGQRVPRRIWRNGEEVRRFSPLPSTPSILTAMLHAVLGAWL